MAVMAKKQTKVHLDPKETFHLPAILQVALEVRAFTPDLPTTKTSILRKALELMLERDGYWPCTPEQIRKLVAKKPADAFSPQVREWLAENGYLPKQPGKKSKPTPGDT